MNIKLFLKKNRVFAVATLCFLIWLIFLVILSTVAQREVIFYDALSQKDVSSDYSSKLPLARYLLEPLIGVAFAFGGGYDFITAIVITFIIFRIIYFVAKKRGFEPSEKAKLLWIPIKDIIRFSFLVIGILVLLGVITVLIMYLTTGLFYVSLHFMVIIQVIIVICFILLGIKIALILMKGLHPNLKLNYSEKKRYKVPERKTTASRISRITRRETSYLFGIILLLAGTNLILLSTYFPTHYIETDLEDDEILLDFHVHTTYSDGWVSAEERVLWYINHGIHGAAFSDHDNLRGSIAAQKFVEKYDLDFIVIPSEEWTDHENNIHMNIFGLDETLVPLESEVPNGPKAMNAEDTIEYVKKEGGYIVVDHYNINENPDGGLGTPYSYEELRDWGVDGFEIVNGGGVRALEIRQFCLDNNLICIAGSDCHTNEDLNTLIKLRLDDPDDLSVDNIFQNLYRNDHEVIAINLNPNDITIPALLDDLGFGFLEDIIEYFLNVDSFQVLSWIIWSCGGYLLFFITFRKIKKLDLDRLRENIL